MHAWTDDLQGLVISLDSGLSFDVVSIDYSIRERESTDPLLQRLSWVTGPEDARLLLTTSFDPTAADLESQWTSFAIDDFGLPYSPWFKLDITGFEDVTSFYLANTIAGLNIDTIVLDVHTQTSPVPEPSQTILLGLGLAALSSGRRRLGVA